MSDRLRFVLRNLAALLLLGTSLRFAVFECLRWQEASQASTRSKIDRGTHTGHDPAGSVDQLNDADRKRREELEAVQGELTEAIGSSHPTVPAVRLRRIVVDQGPERSLVYLNGEQVGQTPYVGQISCEDGTSIRVTVLPAAGAPIRSRVACAGPDLHLKGAEVDPTPSPVTP